MSAVQARRQGAQARRMQPRKTFQQARRLNSLRQSLQF
jgi:hypothetical protein